MSNQSFNPFRVCVECGAKHRVESEFYQHGKCVVCGGSDTRHVFRLRSCCNCQHWSRHGRGWCAKNKCVSLANERCEHFEADARQSVFKVGDRVIYKPKRESGLVTSVNKSFVFVRYDGSKHQNGVATNPNDLEPKS